MKKIISLVYLLTLQLVSSSQTMVTFDALKDNTIYSDNTGSSNGAGDNFTTGSTSSAFRRALLMFDVSSIPAGSTITSASLTLYMNKTVSGPVDVSLHSLTSSWGEGTSNAGSGGDGMGVPSSAGDANWICSFANGVGGCTISWAINGGDFIAGASATTSVNGIGPYVWNDFLLIADVQGWVNNPTNNNGWIIRGDEITTFTAKRFSSRTNPVTAQRPQLSITYTAPLPITLLYFKASVKNQDAELSWKTAQEINNDYFEVDYSRDGLSFNVIGKINAAGNSSQPQYYNYHHRAPGVGKHFYRLRQTDIGGQSTISYIQTITLTEKTPNLIISPNPLKNIIYFQGLEIKGKQQYTILNNTAQVIVKGKLIDNRILLPLSLMPGIYHLRVINEDGEIKSAKFIKQ